MLKVHLFIQRFLIILGLFVLGSQSLDAAFLHAIVIGDTNSDLKRQSRADLTQVQESVQFLANSLNLKSKLQVFDGEKARKGNVLKALNKINVEKDDLLFFYFTGHGYRSASQRSKWPSLSFSTDRQFLELETVVSIISKKNPRFSLVIADCCNVSMSQFRKAPKNKTFPLYFEERTEMNGDMKNLFLKSSGILVISGSSPGEFSWATDYGGIFTVAFLDTFGTRINQDLRNWDDVLSVVIRKTRGIQTPQYQFYKNS